MTNEGIKQLEDLFGLDDSDVDLEDIYSEDVGDATFDYKKEEVNELLEEEIKENGGTKKMSTKDTLKEAISESQTTENKEVINDKEKEINVNKTEEEKDEKPNIVEEKEDEIEAKENKSKNKEEPSIEETKEDEIDFDTTESFKTEEETESNLSTKVEEPKVEEPKVEEPKVEEPKVEEPKVEEPKVEEPSENISEKEMKEEHKNNIAGHDWQLQNPDAKFNHFYKMKRERLQKFLSDGEVPYDAWRKELIKARVDLSSLVFDLDHLSRQMQQVQQHQYRVAEIKMRVNSQYGWCKRSLEFLRGKLAQIAYERPIEKFNGVVYDHLSDVEDYLQQLEVLRDNAELVSRNLDKAAEVISRRVTVVMMEAKTEGKGTRYPAKDEEEVEKVEGLSDITPMKPVDMANVQKDLPEEKDPDDDFIDECDVFEVNSSKEEKKPKKGWGVIPSSKKNK